ncbi:MAG: hypothetical protein FWE88_09855 [Phycisphaerae bacterium]|nr:hypothetical protein [Phycisphaerae bacterium]
MTDTLKKAIESNAKGPRQATADGVTVQQHSLKDQIAADQYLADKEVAKNPARALMRVKIVAPGTV